MASQADLAKAQASLAPLESKVARLTHLVGHGRADTNTAGTIDTTDSALDTLNAQLAGITPAGRNDQPATPAAHAKGSDPSKNGGVVALEIGTGT